MLDVAALLSLVVAASACGVPAEPVPRIPSPNRAMAARAACADAKSADYFFPPALVRPWMEYTDAARIYYGLFLTAMGEPSLMCGGERIEAYRLLRLQSSGAPVAVRVEHRDGVVSLFVTKLEAPTWSLPPGPVFERRRETLNALLSPRATFEAAGFWNLETDPKEEELGGTVWLVEARVNDTYHVVVRVGPGDDSPVRQVGNALLRAAGVSLEELQPDAPGVPFRPRPWHPQIPGLPPPPEPPPPPPVKNGESLDLSMW